MKVRQAQLQDMPDLLSMFAVGRMLQRELGNYYQWQEGYPSQELIEADIETGHSYVVVTDEKDKTDLPLASIVATFYLHHGPNPAFMYTEPQMWVNNEEYVTIHRICTNQSLKGAGKFCFAWIVANYDNVRLYTHRTNTPMIVLSERYGFVNCGEFSVGELEPRLAFHYVKK